MVRWVLGFREFSYGSDPGETYGLYLGRSSSQLKPEKGGSLGLDLRPFGLPVCAQTSGRS